MGSSAKIGLIGVLALIVLVVTLWDRDTEEAAARRFPLPGSVHIDDLKAVEGSSRPPGESGAPPSVVEQRPTRPDGALEGAIERELALKTGNSDSAEVEGSSPPASTPPFGQSPEMDSAGNRTGAEGADVGSEAADSQGGDAPDAPPNAGESAPSPRPNPPFPEPRIEERTYIVQVGDNLSQIARDQYGSSRHWRLLLEANRDLVPEPQLLKAGIKLRVPPLPQPVPQLPVPGEDAPADGAKHHTVKPGESLEGIALSYFGKRGMWRKIYEANRDRLESPDTIRVGQVLRIPEGRP